MNDNNDEITREIELENEQREAGAKPKKIQRGQLFGAKLAWTLGAVAIDIVTGYAIYYTTAYWWYGVMWVVAGAGALWFSEWLWERIGNNDEQKVIADLGIKVSGGAIAFMALAAGVILAGKFENNVWIEGGLILSVVGLFCYHVFQSYRYYILDDEFMEATEEARANAQAEKEIRQIHRAARKVEAKKKRSAILGNYRNMHGDAIDAALNDPTRQKNRPLPPRNVTAEEFAKDVRLAELKKSDDVNPKPPLP